MKKVRQIAVLAGLIVTIGFVCNYGVFAKENEIQIDDFMTQVPYSEEFQEWLTLPEGERENIMQPEMYEDLNTEFVVSNPLYQVNLLGASNSSRFSLKDVIESNVSIRNQQDTTMCWAFAGLSTLETNLALTNYKTGRNLSKVYDYSERHVNYATTRFFAGNVENKFGFNRAPGSGANWYAVENYLTNGQGAIAESQMPFENNGNIIGIEEIENKTVETRVYDTVYFSNYNEMEETERLEEMDKIKQHIQNYGAVFGSIHGDTTESINYSCYNNDTGAKYCSHPEEHPTDHAISIIGWDDEYGLENFDENARPANPGAWIVRNSWGEEIEYDVATLKQEVFATYSDACRAHGWNSAEEIPDEFIAEALGYQIRNGNIIMPIGDHGLMYVSYEDCNIGSTLCGITKAADEVDYDFIYQYNELFAAVGIELNTDSTFICNIFEKETSDVEYLTGVALSAPETYICKVYVNPNGTGKTKSDLQLVELEAGTSETIDRGFHTLEFAEPVELTGDSFVVAVEIEGTRDGKIGILTEGVINDTDTFHYVITEQNKCFIASSADLDLCSWFDLGTIGEASSALTNCDSSLKAYTQSSIKDTSVNRIEILLPPNKTEYQEGENFDKTGMKVRAVSNADDVWVLEDSDYSITNGTNLKAGQTSVTITYQNKSVEQPITVTAVEGEEPQPQPETQAESANFDSAVSKVSNVTALFFSSDNPNNGYVLIDTEISGITRNMSNDTYEYYYYLSSNGNLSTISDWVKITENQVNSDKLVFEIDSRKLSNLNEISKATNLFIYIKETVTKGGNQSVKISKGIHFELGESSIETYVNGAKTGTYNSSNVSNQSNNNNSGSTSGTSSTAGQTSSQAQAEQKATNASSSGKLPYTGSSLLIVGIILLLLVGIGLFIRYEVLNKYVK
ncbi:MAG: bacterial Ig-like domain-containing protein [Clostridia bacterium]|nr:bacterial Ig-like domain-containing protein [Clostridia bacterium]